MQRLRYSRYFKTIFILLDVAVITAVLTRFFVRSQETQITSEAWEQFGLLVALLSFIWILLSGRTKLYSIARNITYTVYLERLSTHIFIFVFGIILLAKVSTQTFLQQDRTLLSFWLFLFLFLTKSLLFFTLKYIRSRGINFRNVMFFSGDPSMDLLRTIFNERRDYGFKVYEYAPEDITDADKLVSFWKEYGIHTMFLSTDAGIVPKAKEYEIYRLAEQNKVRVSLVPSMVRNSFFQYELGYIETHPILVRSRFPLDDVFNMVVKRTFDLAFSVLILLLIGSWLFPLLALLIKLDSRGPVFFIQKRYGYHERVFNCLKFRTMQVNDESALKTTETNDKRITRFGKFLRKTSLDEFPQFINVLKGDMSVVGPRPHMLLVDDLYKVKIGRYAVRSLVQPGITGLAQVNGLRGDRGDMDLQMHKRILADAFYVKNWTLTLDLIIILKTVYLMISGDRNAQ